MGEGRRGTSTRGFGVALAERGRRLLRLPQTPQPRRFTEHL